MVYARSPLEAYRWQSRIVIVFADAGTTEKLAQQHRTLASDLGGLKDRDLLIVTVQEDLVNIDGIASHSIGADRLRDAFDDQVQGYSILLIGKDGGVKMRSKELVAKKDLFALIDGMPMRQREMRMRSRSEP